MPDRLKQVEDLYHAALAQPSDGRGAFLADVCAGDDDLRREVESLIAQASDGESVFHPVLAAAAAGFGARVAPGDRLGPYTIVDFLGAGGMGEVYRARDTRLDRDVALKILPEVFASSPDRLVRFEREAKLLAALNHPNIAQVYGFEDRTLAMEFVAGEDLSQRLVRGALPPAEALPIARQIADALEAAHEAGIIHRDLKPANIKVKDDGTVKVLDFGLAKAMDPYLGRPGTVAARNADGGSVNATDPPTITSPAITQQGVILGTASYMSPEQARGKPVDKRADIWAFGVVLYEMLTGRGMFGGDAVSETLAAVLRDPPALDRLPAGTPPAVRRLLTRCLEHDPKLRLRDIGEARILLAAPFDVAPPYPTQAPPSRRAMWVLTGGAIALAAVVGAIVWRVKPPPEGPVRRLELPAAINAGSAALAPDGSRIAYLSGGHLYVRAFDALAPQDLGAVPPAGGALFWSPDSRTIGLTAEDTIRSLPAGGGPVFVICRIPASGRVLSAAWRTDGTIVFSVWRDSLYKVSATGGTPEVLVAVDPATEIDFHSVSALPDNRVLVTSHLRKQEPTFRLELINGTRRATLLAEAAIGTVKYVAPGNVVFVRFGSNQGVWAVPFAEGPIDLAGGVLLMAGATAFDAANDGTLVVSSPPATSKIVLAWVDRAGAVSPVPGSSFEVPPSDLALSPDGRRVAMVLRSSNHANLVVRDLETGVDTRLTFHGPDQNASRFLASPSWFPSGDRLLYSTGSIEALKIVAQRADGAGDLRELTAASSALVSPDGRQLLFRLDDRGRGRLRRAPILPDGAIGAAQPVFHGDEEPNVRWFKLSPDGSVLAYTVLQADRQSNIFLTRFPSGDGRWQVTTDGGIQPRFSHDGRELFYLSLPSGGRRSGVMAMDVTLRPVVKLAVPAAVFTEGQRQTGGPSLGAGFGVSPDGRRFLMMRSLAPTPSDPPRLVLVQNWFAMMKH